jgi:putative tryptophan/tyrosine transport system substrate-binding protein
MKRREFITLLGGASASWPFAAWAQQPTMPVVGLLSTGSQESDAFRVAAIRQGLAEVGYVEGRNVGFEYQRAEDHYERLPALAIELVRRDVAVIVALGGNTSAAAAKSASATIPIVFAIGGDPIKMDFVASLSRPGGNMTGVSFLNDALVEKQLEVLHETVPNAELMGFLVNPANRNADSDTKYVLAAAESLGQKMAVVQARTDSELEVAFITLVQRHAGALLVGSDPFFANRRDKLVELAERHRIPGVYALREFAVIGGLMSYGTNITEAHRIAGLYAGRILRGEKPADLPVQQSTKVELVINLKTAKAFGLTVPPHIVARADEVIE